MGSYRSTPNLVFMAPSYNPSAAVSTVRPPPPQASRARSVAAAPTQQALRPNQSQYYTVSEKPLTNQPTVIILQEEEPRRGRSRLLHLLLAALAGAFMFLGWWFAVDATVVYLDVIEAHFLYHSPGFVGTMAFLVVNTVSDEYLSGEYQLDQPRAAQVAKLTVFVGWCMAFGALIGAAYIMTNDYLLTDRAEWPGIAVFLQNTLIFLATIVYRLMLHLNWKAEYLASLEDD